MKELTPQQIKMMSRLGSCGAFGMAAMDLAEEDEKFYITTADLCFYSGLTRFNQSFHDRLINLGIAEQNMIGVSAGLAKEGLNVFSTTYASFAVTRCLDQVRVNMGYMNLPIKLVGLTSGYSVGILGATHICLEDIAILRSIPNITILSPADCTETYKAVITASKMDTPVYLRLTGTMGNPIVYTNDYNYEVGKANVLRTGKDVAIIATGTMVYESLKAAELLETENISCSVIDMHTITPLDADTIDAELGKTLLISVEEHSIVGGLGGAISEYIASSGKITNFLKLGVQGDYPHAASYDYLLEKYKLKAQFIAEKIKAKLKTI